MKSLVKPEKYAAGTTDFDFRPINIAVLITGIILLFAALASITSCGETIKEGEATIRIAPGTSTSEIARMLVDEGVIDSEKDFTTRANEAGIGEKLKAGTYRFQRGESIDSILNKLEQGLQAPEGVLTIPEGYNLNDIANLVSLKTSITRNAYIAAATTKGRILPLRGASEAEDLEGFLFPSTYDLDPETDAASLVDRQLETFRSSTSQLAWGNAEKLGLTEYEALIVASMVEREAKVPEERPLVAAVIYNRLDAGMKLEIDATVQYAIGSWKEELTVDDLAITSAYNTRLYAGLPPGPICNPGVESMEAALHPASVDYIYYVATGDAAGHHTFTSSYDEFLEASAASR
ncbi:MAG: endolytic transglycosylase MltG [Thermoleophilia bacterium]|nr:endolytic transglycosylase MltG [Thermoleophilia bacterium]